MPQKRERYYAYGLEPAGVAESKRDYGASTLKPDIVRRKTTAVPIIPVSLLRSLSAIAGLVGLVKSAGAVASVSAPPLWAVGWATSSQLITSIKAI